MSKTHKIEQAAAAAKALTTKVKREKTEREKERDANLADQSRIYARDARARGERNKKIILLWLIKWGWTTNQIIQYLLNVNRTRPADEFVKKGLLDKLDAKPGWIERHVYILSPAGVAAANKLLIEIDRHEQARKYNLHLTKSIPWSTHEHHIIAQRLLIDCWDEVYNTNPTAFYFDSFKTDYELDQDKSSSKFIPDFSISHLTSVQMPDGNYKLELICDEHYEVELNEKTNHKLYPWAWARANYLKKNPEHEIIILTPYKSILENYNKYFSGKIGKPFKQPNGKPGMDPSGGMYLTDQCGKLTIELLIKSDYVKTGGLRRAISDGDEIVRVRALKKSAE